MWQSCKACYYYHYECPGGHPCEMCLPITPEAMGGYVDDHEEKWRRDFMKEWNVYVTQYEDS